MQKLVLFDIDGTLVLTGRAGLRALDLAFCDVLGIEGALEGITFAGRTGRSPASPAPACACGGSKPR